MKTFFEKTAQDELTERLQKLNAQSRPQWGKMSAAQMFAHCTAALKVPVGDLQIKRTPLSLIGWMFKGMIYNGKPFSKNSPTTPEFVVHDERSFEEEKKQLDQAIAKLAQGPAALTCHRHPFFGKMTSEDWGCLMYKHLDHHLQQFGV